MTDDVAIQHIQRVERQRDEALKRIAELEAERDNLLKALDGYSHEREMNEDVACGLRQRDAAIKALAEDRARLRKAITEALGGIGPGASCWGHTQYDKGYSAGGAVALTAFDAAIDAVGEKGGLQ